MESRPMVMIPLDEYTNLIRENQILRCQHEMEDLRRRIEALEIENAKLFAATRSPSLTLKEALAE